MPWPGRPLRRRSRAAAAPRCTAARRTHRLLGIANDPLDQRVPGPKRVHLAATGLAGGRRSVGLAPVVFRRGTGAQDPRVRLGIGAHPPRVSVVRPTCHERKGNAHHRPAAPQRRPVTMGRLPRRQRFDSLHEPAELQAAFHAHPVEADRVNRANLLRQHVERAVDPGEDHVDVRAAPRVDAAARFGQAVPHTQVCRRFAAFDRPLVDAVRAVPGQGDHGLVAALMELAQPSGDHVEQQLDLERLVRRVGGNRGSRNRCSRNQGCGPESV